MIMVLGHHGSMAITASRRRTTATSIGTLIALVLVLIFGSPTYVHWVTANTNPNTAGGLFMRTLAWPAWSFDSHVAVRDLLAQDLKAILLVAFTALFLTLLAGAELARARGTFAAFFTGWAAYIFAAALAGLIAAFVSAQAGLYTALLWATGGAAYGLIVGWIIGLAQMGARRP
jgi:hypothetical protein